MFLTSLGKFSILGVILHHVKQNTKKINKICHKKMLFSHLWAKNCNFWPENGQNWLLLVMTYVRVEVKDKFNEAYMDRCNFYTNFSMTKIYICKWPDKTVFSHFWPKNGKNAIFGHDMAENGSECLKPSYFDMT